jgi:DNA-binding SARP family transcriptional activator/tetratricopeptide (TPR) repeat protein
VRLFCRCLPELKVEVEFKILGPPELLVAGRGSVTISPQLWCVLVSLLMAPNVPVAADVLIDRLWNDPSPRARSTIRSYVWRIDRILSQAVGDVARVSRHAHGYALEINPPCVDLHRFHALKRQSAALADSGEVRQAARLLREAEALWRGTALAGLSGTWIAGLRYSLDEQRRESRVRLIEFELTLGRHGPLLAELGALAEQYPLDEELAAHRMTALFRAGRQTDALRAYRETRARLIAEGVEPAPELARLQLRILQHDPELAITPAYRRADREPQPNMLPADIEDFTGRAEEIRALTKYSAPESGPVVWVIEGMGGVGKTTLAVRAAHVIVRRYPDAQLYLKFRAHDPHGDPLDPADALRELLIMLDVPPAQVPRTLRERTELWQAQLAGRRAVVIFDDVTDPEQIRPLLPWAGDSLVIVTSRLRDGRWGDAHTLSLRVLPENDASALFARIAGHTAIREPGHVAKLSQLCGHLPLAIRLAATRALSGAASLPDLLDELGETGSDEAPGSEVSREVRAAFVLSYRRLTVEEQRFFRYLGIGPCLDLSADSAAVLAGVPLSESLVALKALAGHHLLEETSPGRFCFHDLIRGFAAALFAEADPVEEIRLGVGRLADYYLRAVTRASDVRHARLPQAPEAGDRDEEAMPFTDTPTAAEAWLESEWLNTLRVAEQCARHEFKRRCAELVRALGQFLKTSGHWDDALAAHLMALKASRDQEDLYGAAECAFDLSLIYARTGRSEAALQHASEAADTFGALGDHCGRAAALNRIGIIHQDTARFRDALAFHQEALDISRSVDDQAGLADALLHVGVALGYLGRLREETDYLNRALEIYRESGNLRGQAITLNNMGTVQHYQGYHRDAMQSYQAAVDIFREIGGRYNLALANHNMAELKQYKGNHKEALAIYREVLATYRSISDLQHQAYALADIGSVYRSTERFDEALAHYENAASLAEKAADRYAHAVILTGMAAAHLGAGRLTVALEIYERAARLAGEIESLYLKGQALTGMAEVALHTRGQEAARIYWRQAYDIFTQIGVSEAATVELRLNNLGESAS